MVGMVAMRLGRPIEWDSGQLKSRAFRGRALGAPRTAQEVAVAGSRWPKRGRVSWRRGFPGFASDRSIMKKPVEDGSPEVVLFTDGVQRQPRTGRLGLHSPPPASGKEMERAGGERETTNNRMELLAVIRGLEALKRPTRFSCSPTASTSARGSRSGCPSGSRTAGGDASTANSCRSRTRTSGVGSTSCWPRTRSSSSTSRGHSGHAENERCDTLAWRPTRSTVAETRRRDPDFAVDRAAVPANRV